MSRDLMTGGPLFDHHRDKASLSETESRYLSVRDWMTETPNREVRRISARMGRRKAKAWLKAQGAQ